MPAVLFCLEEKILKIQVRTCLLPVLLTTIVAAVGSLYVGPLVGEEPSLLDANGNPAGFTKLAIGDAAPDFSLPGIDGKTYRLADFSRHDILMVLFTSNHCPTSHAIEKRLQKLRSDFSNRSFGIVAINPNHPDGLNIAELGFGEFTDSFEDMTPYAKQLGWDFPYLYDGETQTIARAYGCLATPHVFILDRERRVRYAGRFDDSRFPQEETVTSNDARNALEDIFAGRSVAVPLTKPHGCSTKWREKRATHAATVEAWTKIPVTVEPVDAEGIARLRANPSDSYRLINVWATWCGPCKVEFPDLVSIARQYDMRKLEFISISLNDSEELEIAQEFLQKNGAGLTPRKQAAVDKEGRKTSHYLFTGKKQDELAKVLDVDWPGPLPHTVLVAPGGEIIWRHNGPIDPTETRKAIVAALTPYYQLPK
jgi:thiol-disulfide isomerase/thioredoxin